MTAKEKEATANDDHESKIYDISSAVWKLCRTMSGKQEKQFRRQIAPVAWNCITI